MKFNGKVTYFLLLLCLPVIANCDVGPPVVCRTTQDCAVGTPCLQGRCMMPEGRTTPGESSRSTADGGGTDTARVDKPTEPQASQERCTNGVDDDKDGKTDCADTDCVNHSACQKPLENCKNGSDDDSDGLADCADPDCGGHPACQTSKENCTNRVDDDNDGLVDCADPDCNNSSTCQTSLENCTNRVDDDNDGLIDCADLDCVGHPKCKTSTEICTNQFDDNGNGLTDCADPACKSHSACTGKESCTNAVDDDGDGLVDCNDPDCGWSRFCRGYKEVCNNGRDDDRDGLIDCKDSNCKGHWSCQKRVELCTNGIDDDKDGLTDCKDSDCKRHWSCNRPKETCTNGVDDDKDGLVDCKDPDCYADPACKTLGQEICNNKIDDDFDGKTDCQDPDCKDKPICSSAGTEVCNNLIDDDGDGATDCADPDCSNQKSCQTKGCRTNIDFGTLQSTGTTRVRSFVTTGETDSHSSVCVPKGGGDIVGVFVLEKKSDLLLSWTQSGDHAFSIYRAGVGQACNKNPFQCLDTSSQKSGKKSFPGMESGRYYIVVEAYGKTLEGKVTLTLTTGSATQKENCGNGLDDDGDGLEDCKDLDCSASPLCSNLLCRPQYQLGALVVGGPAKKVSGDTRNSTNVYDLNCARGGGKDVVISFVLLVPTTLEVSSTKIAGHVLGLVRAAGPGTLCDAGQVSCAIPNRSRRYWNNLKPGTYYMIVDANQPGTENSFQLSLRAYGMRTTELCNNNIDDDGDGAVDCLDSDCLGVGTCPGPVCQPGYSAGTLLPNDKRKTFTLDTRKETDNHQTTCAKAGGKEAVISFELATVSSVHVKCNQANSDHTIALLSANKPRDPCDKNPISCVDIKKNPLGCNFVWPNLQPGKYYVILEGFQKGTEGRLDLTLRAISGTAPEICNNGKDDDGDGLIDCADFNCTGSVHCATKACSPSYVVGTVLPGSAPLSTAVVTSGSGDSYKTTCAAQSGEEAVVAFTMAKQANLVVEYAQFGHHVVGLYANKGTGLSCAASPQGCQSTGGKSSGTLTFKSVPAGKYFLIVDAERKKEGSVLLKISAK